MASSNTQHVGCTVASRMWMAWMIPGLVVGDVVMFSVAVLGKVTVLMRVLGWYRVGQWPRPTAAAACVRCSTAAAASIRCAAAAAQGLIHIPRRHVIGCSSTQ